MAHPSRLEDAKRSDKTLRTIRRWTHIFEFIFSVMDTLGLANKVGSLGQTGPREPEIDGVFGAVSANSRRCCRDASEVLLQPSGKYSANTSSDPRLARTRGGFDRRVLGWLIIGSGQKGSIWTACQTRPRKDDRDGRSTHDVTNMVNPEIRCWTGRIVATFHLLYLLLPDSCKSCLSLPRQWRQEVELRSMNE